MTKILVVDDENSMLTAMKYLLGDKYEVTFCDSGFKALEVIKKTNFDIVLLDMVLGDVSGNEILRKIKERNKDTNVIIISGYDKKEFVFDAGKYGADDYIVKPVDKDELLNLISNLLKKTVLKKNTAQNTTKEYYSNILKNKYTDKELKIMGLLCEEKSNKEIAKELGKNETHVKNVLRLIYAKLRVKNRAGAVKKICLCFKSLLNK